MNSLADYLVTQPPTADRPLLGQTVLAVEDSRFACEAMRLLCLRSGARIRRADSLRTARKHLRVYRPTVVIVDMGLPDGSGHELISEIARATHQRPVLLATSGDDSAESVARHAGADGFLPKPLSSVAAFQAAVLAHLPSDQQPSGPRAVTADMVEPDSLALADDMAHALDALTTGATAYAAQFVEGLAHNVADSDLARAAKALRGSPASQDLRAALAALLETRQSARQAV